MRDGVNASRVAVTAGIGSTVEAFLAGRLPRVTDWPERLARGEVLDEAGQPVAPGSACRAGAVLWYWRSLPPEPRVPFEIDVLHQDEHLVVVDKPHFLPVTPAGRFLQETVLVRLKRLLGIETLSPVHRLDRETAGLVLFSVQLGSRDAYQALLRQRRLHKVYEAVAPWRAELAEPRTLEDRLQERPGEAFMQMAVVPGPPNARTGLSMLGRSGDWALYQLEPETGVKHQLRAQMNARGAPLLGDRIYPELWPHPAADEAPDYSGPLQLLARELAFTDPLSGRARRFTSRKGLAPPGGGQNAWMPVGPACST
ncbi:MAG: pseudouridine synthase [Rubrivivax sp.]